MGLNGLSYSVGGGTDETDAQTLTYSVDGLPEAAIGTVFLADGETAITAGEELTLEQLQGLQFLAAPNASGQAEFSFHCLLYTSPSPRDATLSRMPSSA